MLRARQPARLGRRDAATSPVKFHILRGNVSILQDSGGKIAVLTGCEGKVFVEVGTLG